MLIKMHGDGLALFIETCRASGCDEKVTFDFAGVSNQFKDEGEPIFVVRVSRQQEKIINRQVSAEVIAAQFGELFR